MTRLGTLLGWIIFLAASSSSLMTQAVAGPPPRVPRGHLPAGTKPGNTRFWFEYESQGKFGYFFVALPALIGVGLAAGVVGRQLQRVLPARFAAVSAAAIGSVLGVGGMAALVRFFGPPDDTAWGTRMLSLVFMLSCMRAGWQSARSRARAVEQMVKRCQEPFYTSDKLHGAVCVAGNWRRLCVARAPEALSNRDRRTLEVCG